MVITRARVVSALRDARFASVVSQSGRFGRSKMVLAPLVDLCFHHDSKLLITLEHSGVDWHITGKSLWAHVSYYEAFANAVVPSSQACLGENALRGLLAPSALAIRFSKKPLSQGPVHGLKHWNQQAAS